MPINFVTCNFLLTGYFIQTHTYANKIYNKYGTSQGIGCAIAWATGAWYSDPEKSILPSGVNPQLFDRSLIFSYLAGGEIS